MRQGASRTPGGTRRAESIATPRIRRVVETTYSSPHRESFTRRPASPRRHPRTGRGSRGRAPASFSCRARVHLPCCCQRAQLARPRFGIRRVGADLDQFMVAGGMAGEKVDFESFAGLRVADFGAATLEFVQHRRFERVTDVLMPHCPCTPAAHRSRACSDAGRRLRERRARAPKRHRAGPAHALTAAYRRDRCSRFAGSAIPGRCAAPRRAAFPRTRSRRGMHRGRWAGSSSARPAGLR